MPARGPVKHVGAKSVYVHVSGYCSRMSAGSRTTYKALSLATSVAGGLLAGAVFNQIWRRISDEPEPPDPEDLGHSYREVLTAAALQGLVAGLVRAAVARVSAHGYHAVTHENPGE
jgi:hypothetical protein